MNVLYNIKWSLKQFKAYPLQSIINILGMSIGLTVFALIILYVSHQKNVDQFHKKLDRIYRLENNFGGITPATYLDLYKPKVPEIEKATRMRYCSGLLCYQPENATEIKQGVNGYIALVDYDFFDIFDYPLLNKISKEDFDNPNSIILSESLAKKIFGKENPIGKIITYRGNTNLEVIALMKDFAGNSSLFVDAIIPLQFEPIYYKKPEMHKRWNRWSYETFFLLQEGVSVDSVRKKLDGILVDRTVLVHNIKKEEVEKNIKQVLRPYSSIYLTEVSDHHRHGKKSHILIFSIIAVFVLFIACINYINISTATASNKFKALAIRKIMGANRNRLIRLILFEGILISLISITLSIVLIEFTLPYFKDLTNLDIKIPYSFNLILVSLVVVPIVLGVITALFPSYSITKFNLIQVLKGEYTKGKSGNLFRKVLTIIQFSISVFLIIGTLVVKKQLKFITSTNPGYDVEQIVYTSLNPIIFKHFDSFRDQLLENPDILDITRTSSKINNVGSFSTFTDGGERQITVPYLRVDKYFFEFFNMKFLWGKSFNSPDITAETGFSIVNKKMADWYGGVDTLYAMRAYGDEIIGVVDNFRMTSMHATMQPVVIKLDPNSKNIMYYKIRAGKYKETLKYVEKIWNDIAPQFPFSYKFMDKDFENIYSSEIQFSEVFTVFGLISIFIACIGLFAMSSFIALKRTKEIGIRKSHGASIPQIVLLLSKDLSIWVLIANIIAMPVAYYYMKNWLNTFAYKTELSWWIFVVAILISLVIALTTIFYHTIKTARKNPIESLRYE